MQPLLTTTTFSPSAWLPLVQICFIIFLLCLFNRFSKTAAGLLVIPSHGEFRVPSQQRPHIHMPAPPEAPSVRGIRERAPGKRHYQYTCCEYEPVFVWGFKDKGKLATECMQMTTYARKGPETQVFLLSHRVAQMQETTHPSHPVPLPRSLS